MALLIPPLLKYFNSQPHEEADSAITIVVPAIPYFNSQPHEEADPFTTESMPTILISTHSLTKRLTAT